MTWPVPGGGAFLFALLLVAPTLALPAVSGSPSPPPAALGGATFAFGAAGDIGYSAASVATFQAAGGQGLDFFLALGDTTYGDINETTWCNQFRSEVPHVLVEAGNHDTGENTGADLAALIAACPFTLNETMTGSYGHEWYFDYPAAGPLVRFVLTGCGVSFVSEGGGTWTCSQGDSHYNFVADAIDDARTAGIPWIVVGMHKNCISAATKSCEVGSAFFSMLLTKRVDLILQGHEHVYERSKQLTCATPNTFVAACVADSGPTGVFRKGDGSIVAVAGTGGKSFYGYNPSDAEAGYFATATDAANGFLRIEVNESVLSARFVRSAGASYNDSFVVADPPTLDVTGPADGQVVTNAAVNVTGTTEPDAMVTVNGIRADVSPNGTLALAVPLWPGINTVTVRAEQEWGSWSSWQANVTFDDPAVHLHEDLEAALAALSAAQNASALAQAEAAALASDLANATAQAAAAQSEADNATAQVENLTATLSATAAALSQAQQRADALEASGNATQEELDAARSDLYAAQAEHHAVLAQLSSAKDNATLAAIEAARAQDEVEALSADLARAQQNVTTARMAAEAARASVDLQRAATEESQAEARRGQDAAAVAQVTALVAAIAAASALAFAVVSARRRRGPNP